MSTDVVVSPDRCSLDIRFRHATAPVGWQVYDPATGRFLFEGDWVKPGSDGSVGLSIRLPVEAGRYRVYVSPVDESGWHYRRGRKFMLIDAEVENGSTRLVTTRTTTLAALRRENLPANLRKIFLDPWSTLWSNRSLIQAMVRRDVLARYRGSAGDVLWTLLQPLLLMATYFFVFGVVLQTRFPADQSRFGFALYFLAGMLPWLAISEAIARAPSVLFEHRNFVKRLVFPVETLPVNLVVSGLVTQAFALLVFTVFLLISRGRIEATVLFLPVLLVPQAMLSLGLAWALAALAVFVRDLVHMIGFVLTLWFFLTPICYPESLLPHGAQAILLHNPLYALVRGYRAIFLESAAPPLQPLLEVWAIAIVVFFFGHAVFLKLRKAVPDVI